jgi:oligopeptide/dipeptide ABC transporter ATP-binding protein
MDPAPPLLEIRGLRTVFRTAQGVVPAVDGVSLQLERGRTLALVGESGSGKSVLSLSVMGLVPQPPGEVTGEILLEGEDLLRLPEAALQARRGGRMAMIFQEPMTALNPVYTVGAQIAEAVRAHEKVPRAEAWARAVEMLRRVGMPAPERRAAEHPHRLSGGMRQRAMIAMALACGPRLLIADEPTTALDVTIQAQILGLLRSVQAASGAGVLLITHDLGVVAEMADEVAVMYAGGVVEAAPVGALFADAQHPYTLGLIASIPRLSGPVARLQPIPGSVPPPFALPRGCRFSTRCGFADARCRAEPPPLREVAPGHQVACWRAPVETIGAHAPGAAVPA